MISKLTFDREAAKKGWPDYSEKEIDEIRDKYATPINIGTNSGIEVYPVDENWLKLGIFKEFKHVKQWGVHYGYCSTEEALVKFLKSYNDNPEKNYYVEVGVFSMDDEKYYKHGSYINNDGIDTEDDYDWNNEEEQQYENQWIGFCISEIEP